MALPENTIERAIEGLKKSPATFQRLVESYVFLTYPHQFNRIIPQGRNSSDVTVKGWPDIYSLNPSFKLNVVEVTHSPKWSVHLEEDLAKAEALGSGQLSGFVFVAWANEPSPLADNKRKTKQKGKQKDRQKNPKHEQLVSYSKRLLALGIPPENIKFVFKKQLVRELSQPRFTRVLTDILELPSSSTPFLLLSRTTEIFGTSSRDYLFAPSKEEYQHNLVHRSAITDDVEKRLNTVGWAYLRGRGAAGKTVLAIHIGLAYESRSLPAYYLNLVKTDVSESEALKAITTYGDDGVLFIIDNVHLNEAFARNCYEHWMSVASGSHLLLIGRDTTVIDYRGTALPLDEIKGEALILTVTQEDLEGVLLRLLHRDRNSLDSVSRPPQNALQLWHKLFGGDLIAFSAAAAHRLEQFRQNDWTIQARDATRYVQLAYLGNATDDERLILLRLAASAQLEVDVPEKALDLTKIGPFLQNGLVHAVGRGSHKTYGYYRLVHPGFGDLLLTAANYSDDELKRFISEQYGYIAYKDPPTGLSIAIRLESRSRIQEAALILKGIVELEDGLERMLAGSGIQSFPVQFERLTRLGILSAAEIDDKLTSLDSLITSAVLNIPLHFLAGFLEYADEKLPALYSSLMAILQRPESAKKITESALVTPLGDLVTFFKCVERKLPRLFTSLVSGLEAPESVRGVTESMLSTPVYYLPTFFEYAKRKMPKLYTSLVAGFEQPEIVRRLTESMLRTSAHFVANFFEYAEEKLPKLYTLLVDMTDEPRTVAGLIDLTLRSSLDSLPAFLDYTEKKLPKVYSSIVAVLEQPEGTRRLSERALQTKLNQLAFFLEYANRKLPLCNEALGRKLTEPANIDYLADRACHTPLDGLGYFLQTVTFASAVVAAIDKEKWDKSRLEFGSEQLESFPATAGVFHSLARPDLAEAPAIALVRHAQQQQWSAANVGLRHLAYVMRWGRGAGQDNVNRFISRIVTPSWLKANYENAPTYGIASSLFNIRGYYDDPILSRFNTATLKSRVRRELNYLDKSTPEQLLPALQLIGVSALIGTRVGAISTTWPNEDCINEAIRLANPDEMTTISSLTIQLWLGLRVMAGLRTDQISIQADQGELVLLRWKNSTGSTDKQNALNRSMIDWMQRCAQSEWKLIADRQRDSSNHEEH